MLLSTFNTTHAYPVSNEELNRISARQRTAYSKTDTPPSALIEVLPADVEVLQNLYDEISLAPELRAYLSAYSTKIVNKWWGPQGRALAKPFAELIAPYMEHRDVDIDDLLQDDEIVREFAAEISELVVFLKNHYKAHGTLIATPREAYHVQMRQPKSSTGYRGFTTADSRSPMILASACKSAGYMSRSDHWSKDPFIVWYRDMRQKYRLIFATSLSHMIIYRRFLSLILTTGVGKISSVFYHSSKVEAHAVANFWYTNAGKHARRTHNVATAVVCADYEQMDTGCSLELCRKVLRLVLDFIGLPPTECSEILSALEIFFTSPLIDFEGQVHFATWNLLSGMGPTNGIECLINKFLQVAARVITSRRVLKDTGCALQTSLRVMGDDSALLMALSSSKKSTTSVNALLQTFVSEFINEFESVSKRAGLKVQKQKQEFVIGDGYYTYCREVYPASLVASHAKGLTCYPGSSGVPIPIYPLEYAINNTIRPENYPKFDFQSGLLPNASAAEVAAMFSRLDKCQGDPRFKPYLKLMLQSLTDYRKKHALSTALTGSFVWDAMFASSPITTWREKLYGAEKWQPSYSPSITFIYETSCYQVNDTVRQKSILAWMGRQMSSRRGNGIPTIEEALEWINAKTGSSEELKALLYSRALSSSAEASQAKS